MTSRKKEGIYHEHEPVLAHRPHPVRRFGGGYGGLTSIWFAVGALAALVACAADAPMLVQVVVFLGVSFLTLLLVRPMAQKYVNDRHVATNADRVIGREAVVIQKIDNLEGQGQVSVSGAVWTARSQEEQVIPVGERVRVLRIEGVKVYVTPASGPVEPSEE